jgi:hypothetical protein
MYELTNTKDKSRVSRTMKKGSSTLFDTREDAVKWGDEHGYRPPEYEVREAKDATP